MCYDRRVPDHRRRLLFGRAVLTPGSAVQERQFGAVLLATGHTLLDEVHPLQPIVDVRVDRVDAVKFLVAGTQNNVVVGGPVDVGKGFKESFRMTAR
jgi:hypothetical protein